MNYKIGYRGKDLREYQKKLGIKVDGVFGSQTDTAVRDYQTKQGLTVDGIIGKNTIASLNKKTDFSKPYPGLPFPKKEEKGVMGKSTAEIASMMPIKLSGSVQDNKIDLSKISSGRKPLVSTSEEIAPTIPEIPPYQTTQPEVTTKQEITAQTEAITQAEALPFGKEIVAIQQQIQNSEQNLANLASGKIQAQKDAGLFEMQAQLNEDKAKLRALQDKQIEIPLQEKQRYREAGVVGTKEDLRRATTQDVESAALGAFAQARNVQATADTINANVNIITQQFNAKKSQLEFDIKQKTTLYDRMLKVHGDIMTEKQKVALEDRKFENDLKLELFKNNLKNTASNAKVLAENMADSDILNNFVQGTPDDRDDFARKAYNNGQLDANQYAKITRDNANDKFDQAEKNEKANILGDTIIKNSEWMIGDITKILNWKDEQGNSKLPQILGRIGQYDWIATWGEEDKQMVALLDNIFSKETLDAMSKLKGSPSDKDLALVEDAARAGIDRSINDPTHIINVLTQMKQNLDDAMLKQRTWKSDRSKKQNIITPNIQEVENLLQSDNQNNNIDYDKIIQAESGGSYTALNKESGASGKYQFMPSTLKGLAKDLGISIAQAKTPQGQEAMFKEFTNRNIASLQKANIPINTFTVYGSHQQGSYGFQQILKNNITPTIERNMLANLPKSGRITGDTRMDWLNYWANKMT